MTIYIYTVFLVTKCLYKSHFAELLKKWKSALHKVILYNTSKIQYMCTCKASIAKYIRNKQLVFSNTKKNQKVNCRDFYDYFRLSGF